VTVVPAPASAQPATGVSFPIRSDTVISTDAPAVGEYLAAALRHSTGYPLSARPATGVSGGIELLLLSGAPASVGDELGWSPQATHSWGAFKQRLAAQGPRRGRAGRCRASTTTTRRRTLAGRRLTGSAPVGRADDAVEERERGTGGAGTGEDRGRPSGAARDGQGRRRRTGEQRQQ